MKNSAVMFFVLIFLSSNLAIAQDNTNPPQSVNLQKEFGRIRECASNLLKVNEGPNFDHDARILNDNLLIAIDYYKGELNILTPYFAGKANLMLDKNGKQISMIEDDKTNFSRDNNGNIINVPSTDTVYYIRVPYVSNDPAKTGFYYMAIHDKTYGERHSTSLPYPPRFLAGQAELTPDFANYHNLNGITITGGTDLINSGREYHPLDIEDKLWDQSATNNLSDESKTAWLKVIRAKLSTIPPETKAGPWSCRGMGCYGVISEEEAATKSKLRSDTINMCQSVMNELH